MSIRKSTVSRSASHRCRSPGPKRLSEISHPPTNFIYGRFKPKGRVAAIRKKAKLVFMRPSLVRIAPKIAVHKRSQNFISLGFQPFTGFFSTNPFASILI
jgi:hypothetical protein